MVGQSATKERSSSSLKKTPQVVVGQKSPALNGMGYVFWTLCPVGEAFVKGEAHSHKALLEIGPGFGTAIIASLDQGVKSYTAIELSEDHLEIIQERVTSRFKDSDTTSKLKLLHGAAPKDLPQVENAYDAILADKCIHYFTPDEIETFVRWTETALRPGGRLYVTAVSAHSLPFRKVLPIFMERKQHHHPYPGRFENLMSHFNQEGLGNYPEFHLPEHITLYTTDELRRRFTTPALSVEKTFALSIPTEQKTSWSIVDESVSNIVGAIVIKK